MLQKFTVILIKLLAWFFICIRLTVADTVGVNDAKVNINLKLNNQGFVAFGISDINQDFPNIPQQALHIVWKKASGGVEHAVVDQVNVVSSTEYPTANLFHLASSQANAVGLGVDLLVTNAENSLSFKLVKVYNTDVNKLNQLTMRLTLPELNCEPAPGLQCGNLNFGIAAICISSGCDHKIKLLKSPVEEPDFDQAGAADHFGVDLIADASHPLEGSSFLVYADSLAYRSIAFKKGLQKALHPYFPIRPENYDSTFFPNIDYLGNTDLLEKLADEARNMGFREFMLIDRNWQKTAGGFDPNPNANLANQINIIKKAGLKVRLHHLVSKLDTNNPFYTEEKSAKNANGEFIVTEDNNRIWDTANSAAVNELAKTHYTSPLTMQIGGYYEDGSDWFLLNNKSNVIPLAGYRDYLANISAGNPDLHFQDALTNTAIYPLIKQGVTGDRWQVFASLSPVSWMHTYALPAILERFRTGFIGRMGWLPLSAGGSDDYKLMLNGAVAIGAPITLEPNETEFINGRGSSYTSPFDLSARKKDIAARVSVLAELQGERELVSERAESVQVHYENGLSSVGIYGTVALDKSGNNLGGQAYGIQFSEEGAVFDGKTNSVDYSKNGCTFDGCSAPVTSEGSRIEVPPTPKLVLKDAFTQEIWFKLNDTSQSGFILEKGNGFGIYYNASRKIVGGHLTLGASGRFTAHLASNPAGVANGLKLNDWNHFVYTYDNHSRVFQSYLNGVMQNSDKMPTGFLYIANQAPLYLGSGSSRLPLEGSFKGTLRDLKIYARILNESEIKQAYQNPNAVLSDIVTWMPLKASANSEQHQIPLSGVGVFYLAPLSKTVKIAGLQFNNLRPYGRYAMKLSTAPNVVQISADSAGQSVYTPSATAPAVLNGLDIVKVSLSVARVRRHR